jgi:hypothetical protein
MISFLDSLIKQAPNDITSLFSGTMMKSTKLNFQNQSNDHASKNKSANESFKQVRSRRRLSSIHFKSTKSCSVPRTLSELELHSIKISFRMIESLWRDLSLGMDYISISKLKVHHENLGEIGSELFGKLFLANAESKQVILRFLISSTGETNCLGLDARLVLDFIKTRFLDILDGVSVWIPGF